jgi:NADH-quinone oxidoreductase subunit C
MIIAEKIARDFANAGININCKFNNKLNQEFIIETFEVQHLLKILQYLKTEPGISCEQLIDLCGVDYLHYGIAEWETESATSHGFSRATQKNSLNQQKVNDYRFAVVYNLLSLSTNQRIRVKCFLPESNLTIPSVITIWPAANWYEREVFDLFGIYFSDHPDLRRLLTDYGFQGHSFRKDFPVGGDLEVRFDSKLQKVIYEPVNTETRVSVPKVIRSEKEKKPETVNE